MSKEKKPDLDMPTLQTLERVLRERMIQLRSDMQQCGQAYQVVVKQLQSGAAGTGAGDKSDPTNAKVETAAPTPALAVEKGGQ